MIKALIFLCDGFEEIEFVTTADILKRAGVTVYICSCNEKGKNDIVQGANGVNIKASCFVDDIMNEEFDIIICPGGQTNSQNLGKHQQVIKKLLEQKKSNKWYAAICAAPALVFSPNGILDNEVGTCYPHPNFQANLKDQSKLNEKVVVSNKCITSQGPGTAANFAFKIVELLFSKQKTMDLSKTMIYDI